MRKTKLSEIIDRRADELAMSGKHQDWRTIEIALRYEGFPKARQILDNRFRRQELNNMCTEALKTLTRSV